MLKSMKKFFLEVKETSFKNDLLSLHFTVRFSTYKEVYVKCDSVLTDEILLYEGESAYSFLMNSILKVVRCVMRNYRKDYSDYTINAVVRTDKTSFSISAGFNSI